MCFGGGGGGGGGAAAQEAALARQAEEARQARIREGRQAIDNTFRQFDDNFFGSNRQALVDYARPQLDQQFGDASKELTFDLARSGLLNSSVRGDKTSRLQQLYDQNMQQVMNDALSREQEQRNSVESSRADLVSMLQATGDAQGAANQALTRASMLSAPQSFQPLGQVFQDFTAGLGTQAAMERAGAVSGGRFRPRYDTGLFGTPNNAVRVRA